MSICATAAILIGLYTTHIPNDPKWEENNDNKIVGVQCDNILGATFINSYSDRSYYLGYDLHMQGDIRVGILVGVVSGYPEDILPVPYFAPMPYIQWGVLRVTTLANAANVGLHFRF